MDSGQPDLGAHYLRHRDAMHRVAAATLRSAGRTSEAADVVHDAIVSLMASTPSDVRSWEALLIHTTRRRAQDRLKLAAAKYAGPALHTLTHDPPDHDDVAADVAETVDRDRRAALVRASLSALDERHRKVVLDTVALERPATEVAAEMGVTGARISQMKTRALRLLQEELKNKGVGDG